MPSPPTPEALTAIRAVLQACVLLASSLFITGSFWGGQAAMQQVTLCGPRVSRELWPELNCLLYSSRWPDGL